MKLRIKNTPITVIGKPKELSKFIKELSIDIEKLFGVPTIKHTPNITVYETDALEALRNMESWADKKGFGTVVVKDGPEERDTTLYTVWDSIKITREEILKNIEPIKGIDMDKFQYDPDRDTGYFGWINSNDFITYADLSNMTNMSAGETKLMKEDKGWLVFWYKGDVLFIPQHPVMYNVSWDNINDLELVFPNEDNDITLADGNIYEISLMTGARSNPSDDIRWYKASASEELEIDLGFGSMWNELIYRVHKDIPGKDDEGMDCSGGPQHGENWDNLTDEDLNIDWSICDVGTATWCQETSAHAPSGRANRGHYRLAYSGRGTSAYVTANLGWRPCLKLKKKH